MPVLPSFRKCLNKELTTPQPVLAPWAGYFQLRFVASVKALTKTLAGYDAKAKANPRVIGAKALSAWEQLKPCRAVQSQVAGELKALLESGKASQSMQYWRANVAEMREKLTAQDADRSVPASQKRFQGKRKGKDGEADAEKAKDGQGALSGRAAAVRAAVVLVHRGAAEVVRLAAGREDIAVRGAGESAGEGHGVIPPFRD